MVPKDTAKARQWLEKAAAQGHEAAPIALHILDEQSAQTLPSGIKPGFSTRGVTAQEGMP